MITARDWERVEEGTSLVILHHMDQLPRDARPRRQALVGTVTSITDTAMVVQATRWTNLHVPRTQFTNRVVEILDPITVQGSTEIDHAHIRDRLAALAMVADEDEGMGDQLELIAHLWEEEAVHAATVAYLSAESVLSQEWHPDHVGAGTSLGLRVLDEWLAERLGQAQTYRLVRAVFGG